MQEGIFRSLNLFEFSPSGELKTKVSQFRWPMLWLVAIIALVFNNHGIASYEPFSVFFDGSGNTAQWIIMLFVLLMAMAQMRFWCMNFCPVGAVLDFMARLKRRLKNSKMQNKEQEQMGCGNSHDCSSCASNKTAMSKQDKIYTCIVSIVNVLIIMALMMNMKLIS